jgi:hypothetical protein
VLRSDNLSAATHDSAPQRGGALNRRYFDLIGHYGLRCSLIQVGEAHENGVVEQAHRRTKSILASVVAARQLQSQQCRGIPAMAARVP